MQDASFKLLIGADASQFKATLDEVESTLRYFRDKLKSAKGGDITKINFTIQGLEEERRKILEFGRYAEGTFGALIQKIDQLKSQRLQIKTDSSEIKTLNEEIKRLEAELDKLNTKGGKSFNGINGASKDARTALTSLSLVAQDLPFGFIGIQNNLPRVVESFGQLKLASTGLGGVFKSLGSALVGPAGLFLAFSVVTSAITFAIQKYGDLGTAIDVLFGKKISEATIRAKKDFADFLKELRTTREITTQAASSQDGLIVKLQTLSGIVLDLTKSENQRKNALEQLKSLDRERFKNFDVEKGKLEGLKTAVEEYTNALIAQAVAKKFEDKVAESSIILNQQRDELDKNALALKEVERVYPNVTEEAAKYNKEYKTYLDLVKRGVSATAPTLTEGVVKFTAAQKDLAKSTAEVEKAFGIYTEIKDKFEDATIAANDFYKATEPKPKRVRIAPDIQIGEEGETITNYSNISFRLANLRLESEFNTVNRTLAEKLNESREIIKKGVEIPKKLFKFPEIVRSEDVDLAVGRLKLILAQFLETKAILESSFFNPLENLFTNFFETGKFAFKAFGDAILKEIQRIVARIIASKIIELLANLLVPGSGTAISAVKSVNPSLLKGVPDAFKLIQPRSANLGGIQGGGFGLTGEVVFRQSGSDLVGVLNRTNATINRVG